MKTRGEALEAIAKMTTKLRYHGLPVRRLHSDRAGEFTSKKAKKWAMERLIMRTFTDGSSWKMNGRAEAEVGFIKRLTKTLLKGSGVEENLWPLAARHTGERRWRSQLEAMNYPVKQLRAFGSKAMAKTKAWNHRSKDWEATIWAWLAAMQKAEDLDLEETCAKKAIEEEVFLQTKTYALADVKDGGRESSLAEVWRGAGHQATKAQKVEERSVGEGHSV